MPPCFHGKRYAHNAIHCQHTNTDVPRQSYQIPHLPPACYLLHSFQTHHATFWRGIPLSCDYCYPCHWCHRSRSGRRRRHWRIIIASAGMSRWLPAERYAMSSLPPFGISVECTKRESWYREGCWCCWSIVVGCDIDMIWYERISYLYLPWVMHGPWPMSMVIAAWEWEQEREQLQPLPWHGGMDDDEEWRVLPRIALWSGHTIGKVRSKLQAASSNGLSLTKIMAGKGKVSDRRTDDVIFELKLRMARRGWWK